MLEPQFCLFALVTYFVSKKFNLSLRKLSFWIKQDIIVEHELYKEAGNSNVKTLHFIIRREFAETGTENGYRNKTCELDGIIDWPIS